MGNQGKSTETRSPCPLAFVLNMTQTEVRPSIFSSLCQYFGVVSSIIIIFFPWQGPKYSLNNSLKFIYHVSLDWRNISGEEARLFEGGWKQGNRCIRCSCAAAWNVPLLVSMEATILDQGHHGMVEERLGSDINSSSHGSGIGWLSRQQGNRAEEGQDSGGRCHWRGHLWHLSIMW